MSKISLRFPYLIYLSIASILLGVALAPLFRDLPGPDPSMAVMGHSMQSGVLEIPAVGAPQVAIAVEEDTMYGWNVTVTTENFTFTPGMVNDANAANTGHAHLYLNGTQIARLYGPYYHIPHLPTGEHEISVTLSSNDHSYFLVDGNRIEARTTVIHDGRDLEVD